MNHAKSEIETETFNGPFGPRWWDSRRDAFFFWALSITQSGYAESSGVCARQTKPGGGGAIAGLAAVVLYLKHAQLLVGEVRADLAEVGHDYELVGNGEDNHVGGLQQTRYAQCFKAIKGLMPEKKDIVSKHYKSEEVHFSKERKTY